MAEVHSSNDTLIVGAIFDGPYEGRMVVRTAAEWMRVFPNTKAQVAIRKARDGVEGARYAESENIVWNFQRA